MHGENLELIENYGIIFHYSKISNK